MVTFEPCKRKHHSWYEGTDPSWTPSWGLAGEVEICDRCGTVRRRGINDRGETITVQYIWPDGYREARDEKASKAELRAAWFKREQRMGRVAKAPKKAAPRKLRSVG